MSCPLFIPTEPLPETATVTAPLGRMYAGKCAADVNAEIEAAVVHAFCNYGYGRGHCARAAAADADANRFLVTAALGELVTIAWATERDHRPVAAGTQDVDPKAEDKNTDAFEIQLKVKAREYFRYVREAGS